MGREASLAEGGWSAARPLSTAEALRLLDSAELEIEGRLVEASNATLLCTLRPTAGTETVSSAATDVEPGGNAQATGPLALPAVQAVYKPVRGERPLHDFPDGTLARRERAAWLVSEAAGWSLVPPTVLREGPLGAGMAQLWIEVDPDVDVLALVLARDVRLRAMAVFDIVANNADRKGGHLLVTAGGRVHGCDHGICFAVEPKLRTILWGWAGEALWDDELARLAKLRAALQGGLAEDLHRLLEPAEVAALGGRIERLMEEGRFPRPDEGRRVIPWPPF